MRKIAMLAAICGFAVVVPAQADRPAHPQTPNADHPENGNPPNQHKCVARSVGYNASGTIVSANLTKLSDGRYSGPITVNVTRANHHGATGSQTFTLTDARVNFHHGVDPANRDGDRAGLHGKVMRLPHGCPTGGFTPTVTIKKLDVRTATKA